MTAVEMPVDYHDDLACADIDLLLTEATDEVARLKEMLLATEAALITSQSALHSSEHRADMLGSLNADLSKRYQKVTEDRDALAVQVKMVHDELTAAEKDALPADTLTHAALPRDLMVSTYRSASRITRGPLPPAVVSAVEAAREEICAAMTTAGQATLDTVVRREVRRRRRTQRPARTGTARR